jgi:hypothetical protein
MLKPILTAILVTATFVVPASADLTTYTSQPTFQSHGTIVFNTNWDGQCGGGYCSEPNPYTIGGVTYTTGNNLLVGAGGGYGNSRAVFVFNGWTPLPGTISTDPEFDMFGFSIGMLGGDSLLDASLTTNLGTYMFTGLTVPNVNSGLHFLGYVAGPGEYFTYV